MAEDDHGRPPPVIATDSPIACAEPLAGIGGELDIATADLVAAGVLVAMNLDQPGRALAFTRSGCSAYVMYRPGMDRGKRTPFGGFTDRCLISTGGAGGLQER
jgi:hypothetical protein